MYNRLFTPPHNKSFFLFGPRGTGKTTWLKTHFKDAIYLDFLRPALYQRLLGSEKSTCWRGGHCNTTCSP